MRVLTVLAAAAYAATVAAIDPACYALVGANNAMAFAGRFKTAGVTEIPFECSNDPRGVCAGCLVALALLSGVGGM
jgi:hypothetical protein